MWYDISSKLVRGLLVRDLSGYEVTLIRPWVSWTVLSECFNGYTVRNYGLLRKKWFPARCNFVFLLLQFVFVLMHSYRFCSSVM